MKRSMFRLLTNFCVLISIATFASAVLAQGNGNGKGNGGGNNGGGGDPPPPALVEYHVEYANLPQGTSSLSIEGAKIVEDGNSTRLLSVGYCSFETDPSGESRGFVYDQSTNTFYDVANLLGLGNSWKRVRCFSVNRHGIVVGYVQDESGPYRPMWFDFLASTPVLNLLEDTFSELSPVPGWDRYCYDINDNCDILIRSQVANEMRYENFVANPVSLELVEFWGLFATAMNNNRIVVGLGETSATVWHDLNTGNSTLFTQYEYRPFDLNNNNAFCSSSYNLKPRGRPSRLAFMHTGGNPNDAPTWTSEPMDFSRNASSLNDDGDVVCPDNYGTAGKIFLYHSSLDTMLNMDQMVNEPYFTEMSVNGSPVVVERDNSMLTPSPIVVGSGEVAGAVQLYFLIPEDTP